MKSFTLDFETSYRVYQFAKEDWEANKCYLNIYRFFNTMPDGIPHKVAFGYMGVDDNPYVRHCYMIAPNNKVIDPSIFLSINDHEELKELAKDIDYYTFAIMDKKVYFSLLKKENALELKNALFKLELVFFNFAVENQLPILRIDYEDYLKEMDNLREINVKDGSFIPHQEL
jgi:hypothetical protein